jgi:acyl carrier protein
MKNQIGLDSLELLLMMNYIEEEFKIEIDDNEFMGKSSFGEIINYVDDRVNMAA